MGFISIIQVQIMLFILIFIGYVGNRVGVFVGDTRKGLTNFLVNIIMPCNIFMSFQIELSDDIINKALSIFLISFCVQFFSLFMSKICYIKFDNSIKKVMQYGTICSNAGFIGMAMSQQLYGATGLLYTSIFLIPFRIFMWSAGVAVYSKEKNKSVFVSVITHPCIIAVIIGLIFMLFKIKIPIFLENTLNSVGNCTTAVSMILIGIILSDVSIKGIVDGNIIYYSFIRLIFIPIIILVFLNVLNINGIIMEISVMLSGMPAAATTAVLAEKYNCNSKFAAKCVFVSTLLSLITIPIFIMIIG